MRKQVIIRRFFLWSVGGLMFCVFLYISLMLGIYRRTAEIDVNSGLLRERTCLFFVCLHEKINETPISRYATKLGDHSDWRKVSIVPIWPDCLPHSKVFVDLAYGNVPVQIENLSVAWGMRNFSEDQMRESAGILLKKWREANNSRAGNRYVFDIGETSTNGSKGHP